MIPIDVNDLAWHKGDGLIPAVVQHTDTGEVLMVAWMNREALELTQSEGHATFYSRSRQAIWRKGETSGNVIRVTDLYADCDGDTLLLRGRPTGPVCHTGNTTCFEAPAPDLGFLATLEHIIDARIAEKPDASYTAKTYARGLSRMAQKVGEEGLEVALAAVQKDQGALISEGADLLFHLLLLLRSQDLSIRDVALELKARHVARA
jgi:phosphoribosyl-ATP pyrophosphohydrolase/phosphoribosyl-AMP cyclohydrolase